MGMPLIRHVRYEDFIAVLSGGASDLRDFQETVDTIVRQMGPLHHHHVLVDLRGATIAPLPQVTMVEALNYLRRVGLGVSNRIAFVAGVGDEVRMERLKLAEAITRQMGMHFRAFEAYEEALDWLNEPTGGP